MTSRRIVDRVYLRKPINGEESSPKIGFCFGGKNEHAACRCILCVVCAYFSGAWIICQLMLLVVTLSTPSLVKTISWWSVLMPTTCFLGILAFLFWGTLIYASLCTRKKFDEAGTENQNDMECCNRMVSDECFNRVLFGLVAFFLPAFIFMVMLTLSLKGYFDSWIAVVTSVLTGILFVLIYLVLCTPNKCRSCIPSILEAHYEI